MGRMIDADVLDDVVQKLNENGWEITRSEYKRISNVLFEFPTIEERKTGKWIVVSDGYGNGEATAHICECSECKDTVWVYKDADRIWNYCPHCGAKMEGAEE